MKELLEQLAENLNKPRKYPVYDEGDGVDPMNHSKINGVCCE